MEAVIELRVNCASEAEAAAIADAAVERRLAATAATLPPVASRFRWQSAPRRATEWPAVLRTRAGLFDALAALIRELHAYEMPGIAAVRLDPVAPDYRGWILAETGGLSAPEAE